MKKLLPSLIVALLGLGSHSIVQGAQEKKEQGCRHKQKERGCYHKQKAQKERKQCYKLCQNQLVRAVKIGDLETVRRELKDEGIKDPDLNDGETLLVTDSDNNAVKLWNTRTKALLQTLREKGDNTPVDVEFADNGAIRTHKGGITKVWSRTGELISEEKDEEKTPEQPAYEEEKN